MVGKNIKMRQPPPGCRRYKPIYSKKSDTMLSAASTSSKKARRPSRSNSFEHQTGTPDQSPPLSDVPCYTCRRRHVKCDRILPHCAKCAKKGVTCLGYRKPLRWADGVAVRGKLKGKSQPVLDSAAISVSQNILEQRRTAVRMEAAQYGLYSLDTSSSGVAISDAAFTELIHYHNTVMCSDYPMRSQHPITHRKLATISPDVAGKLPRIFLNCILGVAAVHMAVRNPLNRMASQLALETKVTVFESMNVAFQQANHQRADVLYACILLMFNMEVIESGTDNLMTHFGGAIKLINSSGGIDRFISCYPHLKLQLLGTAQMQTMLIILDPTSFERLELISGRGLKVLLSDTKSRESYFIPTPIRLLSAIYDTAECVRNIFQSYGRVSNVDAHTRECILSDILKFQPEESTEDTRKTYYSNNDSLTFEPRIWNLIYSAWRGAIAIVALRYLYFGLPDPELSSPIVRSPAASPNLQPTGQHISYNVFEEFLQGIDNASTSYDRDETAESYTDSEHLSSETYMSDPFSRTPSPLPPFHPSHEDISLDHWHRRYDIHNDAMSELVSSLSTLSVYEDASYLRYALIPLMILGLVSRPGSMERTLYFGQAERFQQCMAQESSTMPNPIGGSPPEINIPWDLLDSYSMKIEEQQRDSAGFVFSELHNTAPEWNWYHMLRHLNLTSIWPTIAGTIHLEVGTEFWAFNILSTCCTDEFFTALSQPPSIAPQASASAETATA